MGDPRLERGHMLVGERHAVMAPVSFGERAGLTELGECTGGATLLFVAYSEIQDRSRQRVEPSTFLELAARLPDITAPSEREERSGLGE
jgi:hypothetical protein